MTFRETDTGATEEIILNEYDEGWLRRMPVKLITYSDGKQDLHRQTGPQFEEHIAKARKILLQRGLEVGNIYSTMPTGAYLPVTKIMDEEKVLIIKEVTKPPRNIVDVIDQIVKKIPADQVDFVKRLDWVINDSSYRPPEDQKISWEKLFTTLREFLPKHPTTKWQCEVISIFSTAPLEQIMKDFNVQE